jgi:glucose/arabinose dehydrogenase
MTRKRNRRIVFGVLGLGVLVGGALGARWWQRQHQVRGADFQVPVATNRTPARILLLPVAAGFERVTDIQFVPGGGTKAVVVEQGGHARLLDVGPALAGGKAADGHTAPLVLDIWVRSITEMGLLGLAFHPRYPERPLLYAYYDPWVHTSLLSRIAEFKLPLDELGKHPAKETRVLLELEQKVAIHQGGQVAFGPDGKLYVGMGDGGTANDSFNNAQNLGSLNGKMLRLDVDGPSLIPKDNPFVSRAGARPEVWAYGLRNPWRFSFDSKGRAIVGDVGQEGREELDLVSAGLNYGWKMREGSICSQTSTGGKCPTEGLIDPVYDYGRAQGASVTAGYIATGDRVPSLKGKFIFADFVSGKIWSMNAPTSAPAAGTPPADAGLELLGEWPRLFTTFGRDGAGDLYVADMAMGEVLALMPPH